jgi:hypothetical protein
MSGYNLPGLKLLNRIYKTENRRNGNLGPVYFYNIFLANNKKVDIPSSTNVKNTDVVSSLGDVVSSLGGDINGDSFEDIISPD